ncbi:uncharacterized protein LOC119633726 isoform X1 [Glossina fuscipes]|uniref:Uncharacterized protein LOC119633726 isoform X1 n=2 Tax=Nemorhina TaxID=44051 RepID=A0A8U0WDS7_9MUSC|nr:uncharacterized protein LOC119633726 isoform X1 [Glossina fuscipes]
MDSKIVNIEILVIYFLLLIPWPQTQVIKFLCSKDSSRLVRKIVRSKWTPILDKYQVKLPLECPLHPLRDLFAPRQDAKKRDRPTQWTCRLCGKSFYQEKFLDLHFESRHKTTINEAEDAVCLAEFCDIMRCEVFQTEESSSLKVGDQHISTDIEVWGDSFGQNSALAKANLAYLSILPLRTSSIGASRAARVQNRQLCQEQIGQKKFQQTDNQNTNENSFVYNGKPSQQRHYPTDSMTSSATSHKHSTAATKTIRKNHSESPDSGAKNSNPGKGNNDSSEAFNNTGEDNNQTLNDEVNGMQKVRADCKVEELSELRTKCEYLVRSCIGGLILQMIDQSFKEMEDEMNKAVCWYLTCERYWEDGPLEPRAFPWGLILILVFVLSTGICFCYYIIWILFDSEETTINAANHQQVYLSSTYPPQPPPQSAQPHTQELYHYQEFPTTGIHHGMTSDGPPNTTQFYYQQQQQQTQAQMGHDIYPEPVLYDYRHSPRRYIGDQRRPGTPTVTMSAGVGVGQTPLRHQPTTSLAYQQDILDRRDYINRPIATTAVTSVNSVTNIGPNAASLATHHHSQQLDCDSSLLAGISGATAAGGVKHYNTIPRPLESRQRYVSGSQQSLRASSSTHEIIQNEVGHNEHYIYVTYPPDLKKCFFEKYE